MNKEAKVKKIFKDYNKNNFVYQLNGSEEIPKQKQIVEFVLRNISEENSEFLAKEFVEYPGRKNWYLNYYSKSSYYRYKRAAIAEFLKEYDAVLELDETVVENEKTER